LQRREPAARSRKMRALNDDGTTPAPCSSASDLSTYWAKMLSPVSRQYPQLQTGEDNKARINS
jgi:hypothetical protein